MKNLFKKSQTIKDRDRTKQSFIYYFIILSGLFMFVYGAISLFSALPFVFTFSPIAISVLFILCVFIKKNWKLIWLYASDMERGKLMLYLTIDQKEAFEYEQRLRLVRWVYPHRDEVRMEKKNAIEQKVYEGKQLTDEEKELSSRKPVSIPQQIIDGFNKAITVDALIYAHRNIQLLSDEVRDKFELTDENISKFNLQNEVSKCK